MKKIRLNSLIGGLIVMVFTFISFGYFYQVFKLNYFGARISAAKLPGMTVEVLRMPYTFSFDAPFYQSDMFPGYILIKVRESYGDEISSFSMNHDSFYPSEATATLSKDGIITIDILGDKITCEISPGKVIWLLDEGIDTEGN